MDNGDHSSGYLAAAGDLLRTTDPARLDAMASGLAGVRERGGRLFIVGVGGGAGDASHAVIDFRNLCGLDSYAPTDN
ncbi:MAG: sugar isomerase, partial [Solirubrobacterales bacterium]